jgi:uncharacterized protein YehS (DUF1456 family)
MINNDILRSVRYILQVSEYKLISIIKISGVEVTHADMIAYLKKEDDPGFVECPQNIMSHFLNGLIYYKRGKDENRPPLGHELPTNNIVLKKLRVAFELRDDEIISLLQSTGLYFSKTELSAFFRKEGHPNYRICGDQLLRNFLKGLTLSRTAPGTQI